VYGVHANDFEFRTPARAVAAGTKCQISTTRRRWCSESATWARALGDRHGLEFLPTFSASSRHDFAIEIHDSRADSS